MPPRSSPASPGFGPAYDHVKPDNPDNAKERGLLFLSYQRKIARQFEILNHDWMNNPGAPQAGGFDLLVGQNVPETGLHAPKTATYFGSVSPTPGIDFETPNQWIIPTGGAFLFAPSLTFIGKYSDPISNHCISPNPDRASEEDSTATEEGWTTRLQAPAIQLSTTERTRRITEDDVRRHRLGSAPSRRTESLSANDS